MSYAALGFVVALFYTLSALFQPLAGFVVDRFGGAQRAARRRRAASSPAPLLDGHARQLRDAGARRRARRPRQQRVPSRRTSRSSTRASSPRAWATPSARTASPATLGYAVGAGVQRRHRRAATAGTRRCWPRAARGRGAVPAAAAQLAPPADRGAAEEGDRLAGHRRDACCSPGRWCCASSTSLCLAAGLAGLQSFGVVGAESSSTAWPRPLRLERADRLHGRRARPASSPAASSRRAPRATTWWRRRAGGQRGRDAAGRHGRGAGRGAAAGAGARRLRVGHHRAVARPDRARLDAAGRDGQGVRLRLLGARRRLARRRRCSTAGCSTTACRRPCSTPCSPSPQRAILTVLQLPGQASVLAIQRTDAAAVEQAQQRRPVLVVARGRSVRCELARRLSSPPSSDMSCTLCRPPAQASIWIWQARRGST